ncbi:unnamed protein product [Owenia fusiformis]|uniref:Uncharacterized protein n=1 Tax=Owenia fusiformis TaxID=6347 RepID=A0A8J1TCT6_OWEFU|nr:unnamed protein product [Owenia fusiformis]
MNKMALMRSPSRTQLRLILIIMLGLAFITLVISNIGRRLFKETPAVLFSSSELSRFKETLAKWPNKPKAVIYFLVQGNPNSWAKFGKSLKLLDANFNGVYRYPVVVFHETGVTFQQMNDLRRETSSDVYFQLVVFNVPQFLTETPPNRTACSKHGVGYRHMCRFHAGTVYDQPVFNDLEFYWRLDDDSQILRPINYDVFSFMKIKNLWYGYILITHEPQQCVTGLWELTEDYLHSSKIQTPQSFYKWKKRNMFYNNFEISRVDIWKNDNYVRYFDHVDKSGGIYYHRWGDAVIKGLGVAMFVPTEKTHCFDDIKYKHGFWDVSMRSLPSCNINIPHRRTRH